MTAAELLALCWDIHPETALTTYRAGTLDLEANRVCWLGWRRQVDVGASDVWAAIVGQRQQVDDLAVRRLGVVW